MKTLISFFAAIVAVIVALCIISFVFAYAIYDDSSNSRRISPSVDASAPRSIQFIELCSGLKVSTESKDASEETVSLIAVSNCLGRIRGFAVGHEMTAQLQKMSGAPLVRMWCIKQETTDREVLEAVLSWVEAHPKEYDSITKKLTGQYGALSVAFKALSSSFPCKDM